MKNKAKPVMKKVRSKFNPNEIYYTLSDWGTKEVEGVTFIYVIKNIGVRETPKLMKKDSLEFVK
jgi:hypothetical protein